MPLSIPHRFSLTLLAKWIFWDRNIVFAGPLHLGNIHIAGFPCCLSEFKFCLIVQFSTSVRGGDDCVTMSGNLLLNDDSSLLLNSVIVNSNT